MNWDNLQNRMQRDASQKEVKVDIDEIWAAIEPEVDAINQERRKKKFPFFWMFGLLGLMLTMGGVFYLFNNNTLSDDKLVDFEKMERHTDEHSHSHEHTHTVIEESSKQEGNSEKGANERALNKTGFEKNEVPKEVNSSASTGNQLSVEESILRELERLENPTFGLTEKNVTEKTLHSANEINGFLTKNEIDKVGQVIGSTDNNKITKDKLPWKISQSDQEVQPTNELDNSDLILSNVSTSISNSGVQLNEKIIGKELLAISKLSMLTMNLPTVGKDLLPAGEISNYYTALTREEIEEILSNEDDDQQYGQPKFTFSLGLMGGIGSAPNTLTAKNDTVSSLLLIRRETESSLETSQVGLTFSLIHESGIHLSTGLQQTTFVEKVAFNDMVTMMKDVEGITEIIINPNGDSTFVTGLVTETTVFTIEKKHYVRYKLLELPLIVGWQTKDKAGTGWKFGVEAGIVPNLKLTTKGRILNEEYDDIDIGTNQEAYFKNNIGISYHLGFSVRRMLTDNIELSLKPTVRFFPKDFSATENSISQKYNLVSGQVGVSYIFGK